MKLNNKAIFLLLTIVFTVPAVFSLFYHPFFTFHDETQIVNLYEIFKSLDLGQFPPRWGLDFHFNYGSPFPQFYYQLPYYLGYLIHRFLDYSVVTTFKALLISGFFIGAIGMYFLALEVATPLWSLVAATVYTYTPYRAVASFVRGSLGESLALALFPWVFLASYRLYKKPNTRRAVVAGLSWSSLVLTHQLATIFFIPMIGLLGVLVIIKNRAIVRYFIISVIISFLTSAFYLVPLIFESKFIKPSSPFNFYDHFPFLKQLIYSPWGYRASIWGIDDGLSFQIGIIPLFLLGLTGALSLFLLKSKESTLNKLTFGYLLLAIPGTIFLMNIRSSFFWNLFPLTQIVQFPWRLLMLTTFLIPAALIFATKYIPKKISLQLAIFVLFLAPISTIRFFQPGEIYDRNDDYYLHRFLPNQASEDQGGISQAYLEHAEDYVSLPINAVRPNTIPSSKLTATNPNIKIENTRPDPFNLQYQLDLPEESALIFHTFAYPNWNVFLDGAKLSQEPNDKGIISFNVPAGQHQLSITYQKTPIEKYSDTISLIAIIVSLVFLLITHHYHPNQADKSKRRR